jgi:diguanylate cyclase (GGDEF)-like protein
MEVRLRERVLLFGEMSARPDGLERSLVRAGFSPGEGAAAIGPAPDLALVAVQDAGPELERALSRFTGEAWAGVPVIVLLATDARDGVARALALGAADAMAAPVNLPELGARLEARLRNRDEVRRAVGAGTLQSGLFLAIEAIAAAQRPEEMLETLVHRLGEALDTAHCTCLVPSSDRRHARLVATHENPTLRNVLVDLFRYPEAVEAAVSGRTVHAPEVLRHAAFLAHLAHWPDSPEVHEIESAAAVPIITGRAVRAVLVLRTRRAESALSAAQVALVEQLANATAALLEREDRRSEATSRPGRDSGIDALTGCATPESLHRRLRDELERARRYGSAFAFAILDVTGLEAVTTRLGADATDRVRAELGAVLLREVRAPDFVGCRARDRFGLLMPSTGLDGAERALERIQTRLASHPFKDITPRERPGFVAGLVAFPQPGVGRVEDLLAMAERQAEGRKGGKAESGVQVPAGTDSSAGGGVTELAS